jgi:3',5'-cyclic AMP phosphodiesterase CpdA
VKFSIAHFSDVHLGPLPKGAVMSHFALKKVIGALSWNMKRKALHLPQVAAALRDDILAANVDHIAFTGDLVNISAWQEFDRGLDWLKNFSDGQLMSYTPGNHDAYVHVPWENSLGKFTSYMTNENPKDETFPFIRLRRNIALIGLNSASPQDLFGARGSVGPEQLGKLKTTLRDLHARGFYRCVMIHHPPIPGLAHLARALTDASDLADILKSEGAELAIHGHNHEHSLNYLESTTGRIPIIGVPSASMTVSDHYDVAAWNRYDIERIKGQWKTSVSIRKWNGERMVDAEPLSLETPQ